MFAQMGKSGPLLIGLCEPQYKPSLPKTPLGGEFCQFCLSLTVSALSQDYEYHN